MFYFLLFIVIMLYAFVKWALRYSIPAALMVYGIIDLLTPNQTLTGAILLTASGLFIHLFFISSRGTLSNEYRKTERGENGEP